MDLLALADFNLVAAHGGFGRAGRAAGRPKATLSRRVADLERALGVRLVACGTRALRLTEEGAALHARTAGLFEDLAEAVQAVAAGASVPRGRLRVSAPVVLSQVALARVATRFAAAHPAVQLELVAEDRLVDAIEEGYDLVIRVNPAPDERLVGRCVLRDERVVVALPGMARPPSSASGAEPPPVPAVMLGSAADAPWRPRNGAAVRPDPVLRLSSHLLVRAAVLAGAGAALLPRMVVDGDLAAGRLVSWGTTADGAVEIWALHGSRRLAGAKVRAFLGALDDAFPGRRLAPWLARGDAP